MLELRDHTIKRYTLPLDKLTTTGKSDKPRSGDVIKWKHYNLNYGCWETKEEAWFGTPEFQELTRKYNDIRNGINNILIGGVK